MTHLPSSVPKLLGIAFAAVLLGVASLIAVASPASADQPVFTYDCNFAVIIAQTAGGMGCQSDDGGPEWGPINVQEDEFWVIRDSTRIFECFPIPGPAIDGMVTLSPTLDPDQTVATGFRCFRKVNL